MSEGTEHADCQQCSCADFEQFSQVLLEKVAYQNVLINSLAVEVSTLRKAQQMQADVVSVTTQKCSHHDCLM